MAGILDQKTAGSPSAPQKSKVMISIDSFLLGLRVPFDVYSKDATGFSCVLRKWTKFDQDIKTALKSKGMMHLYVEGEPGQVKEYFNEKPATASASSGAGNYDSYSKDKDQFHHVSRLVFSVGTRVNFSIFTVADMRFVPVIETLPEKPVPVTDAVRNAQGDLAIKLADRKLFREYLSALSKGPATDNKTAVQARVVGIKEDAKMSVRDFLSDPGNSQNTEGIVNSANQIITVLKRKEAGLGDMLTLRARDMHIYNHCANVAVLSSAMALAMGMDQNQTEKIAIAAMMHDVGKRNLQPEILHKKDRLTPEEFALWKSHVAEGVRILLGKSGISRESSLAVQQHHERLSGAGYPAGLSGRMISPFGRIISLVDCYDSLTTPRPLRPVYTPYMALNLIMKETSEKGDFDLECVKLFIKILKGQGRV